MTIKTAYEVVGADVNVTDVTVVVDFMADAYYNVCDGCMTIRLYMYNANCGCVLRLYESTGWQLKSEKKRKRKKKKGFELMLA